MGKRLSLNPTGKSIAAAVFFLAACHLCTGQAQDQSLRQKVSTDAHEAPHIEIANVLFRYSPEMTIYVVRLRGTLVPTEGHAAPSFNDANSFVIASDAAEIRITTAQLSALMNSWLLSSPKAQLKNVQIHATGNRLIIQGTMKKGLHVPFRAEAEVSVTNDNRLRISVDHMQAAHLPVKGLLDTFGVNLDDLISQKGLKGMSVEGDSFLIDPQTALPPPQLRAKLTDAHISNDNLVLRIGPGAPVVAHSPAKNYIALRGGSILYGREEMFNADLTMIDSTPADPFEFYLKHYWCQMVAGAIKVTPDQALRINVPDFSKLPKGSCAR